MGVKASVTWNKSALRISRPAATLSNTEPKDDFDNEDDEILNAFTATVNPTEEIVEDEDEEEDMVEFKFEKMDK